MASLFRGAPPRQPDQKSYAPPEDDDSSDAPDLQPFTEVLFDLDLTVREFTRRYPHVGLYHVGFNKETHVDVRQLEEGEFRQ